MLAHIDSLSQAEKRDYGNLVEGLQAEIDIGLDDSVRKAYEAVINRINAISEAKPDGTVSLASSAGKDILPSLFGLSSHTVSSEDELHTPVFTKSIPPAHLKPALERIKADYGGVYSFLEEFIKGYYCADNLAMPAAIYKLKMPGTSEEHPIFLISNSSPGIKDAIENLEADKRTALLALLLVQSGTECSLNYLTKSGDFASSNIDTVVASMVVAAIYYHSLSEELREFLRQTLLSVDRPLIDFLTSLNMETLDAKEIGAYLKENISMYQGQSVDPNRVKECIKLLFVPQPAETKPAETKPAEPTPAEPKPAEPTPAESTPNRDTDSDAGASGKVQKVLRETDGINSLLIITDDRKLGEEIKQKCLQLEGSPAEKNIVVRTVSSKKTLSRQLAALVSQAHRRFDRVVVKLVKPETSKETIYVALASLADKVTYLSDVPYLSDEDIELLTNM